MTPPQPSPLEGSHCVARVPRVEASGVRVRDSAGGVYLFTCNTL